VTLSIIPVTGIGEVRPGDELAELIAHATTLLDGDCLVVTQKVVSKVENRLVPLAPDDMAGRRALVESESVRIVRRRGDLIISETRHGFVCANAGVDLSNVEEGWAALLPVDADRSAKHIRDALRARAGTEVAIADEIASAAELVMGKAAGIPAAIVRGLEPAWFRDGSVRELIRPTHEDLFR
jgi:coenzyme F420-0:L-glutamate ligase/coenzyme F420-1:gamma-L-glutamate ligase